MLKIIRNKRTKTFVVFETPDIGGGLWHIRRTFKTLSEAEDWVKRHKE